jgi:hypothetical protein
MELKANFMRLQKLLAVFALSLFITLGLPAQTVRVIFATGKADLQAPGEASLRPVTKGEVVTLGTRIVTGADGRVALTPMPGVKSLISPNSDLVIEKASETKAADGTTITAATLNLKQGAIVTDLIKQEGVTYDYNIRTPRGLAGARGTNYTVNVNAAGIETILVSHGTISFILLDGRQLAITAGQIHITDVSGAVRSAAKLSDLSAEDQALAQSVAKGTLTALESATAAGITINPEAVSQALDLMKSFGIDTSSSNLQPVDATPKNSDDKSAKNGKEAAIEVQRIRIDDFQAFVATLTQAQSDTLDEILTKGGFDREDPDFKLLFTHEAFRTNLRETIDLYDSLSHSERQLMVNLSILGDANLAAVGTNSEGLARLLETYNGLERAAPDTLSETAFTPGTSHFIAQNNVFFPGTSGASGQTIYNPQFGDTYSPGDLFIGATRFLRIANTTNVSFESGYINFNTGASESSDVEAANPGTSITHTVNIGGDVALLAGETISLGGLPNYPITFSADTRAIFMQSVTLNLANIRFPEGSISVLISRDGGNNYNYGEHTYHVPNFGTSVVGGINFLGGVYYGDTLLDSPLAYITGSRDNIALYSFEAGLFPDEPDHYTPPLTAYQKFLVSLNSTQTTSFQQILTRGGFDSTDSLFLAKFSDTAFTAALRNTIDLYTSLSSGKRTQAVSLGILGDANLAAVGADSQGLTRLIDTYYNIEISAPTSRSETDFTADTSHYVGSNNVFFPGAAGASGQTIYNGLFGDGYNDNPLYIGATRYLRLSNTASIGTHYTNIGSGSDTANLFAGDEISLNGLVETPFTFSADTRYLTMQAITLNLANVNFPAGSTVQLISRDGGVLFSGTKVPNFGSSVVGRVNFLGGVFYGDALLDSPSAFVDGSFGAIGIHSFSDAIDTTTDQSFIASLTPAQFAVFSKLPAAVRIKLVALNDPDITGTLLSTTTAQEALPLTAASTERYLDAYLALSSQSRAFFKALGGATGTGLTNINGAPDLAQWSPEAIETAAANFYGFSAGTQTNLVTIGAGNALVGLQPDYVQGLLTASAPNLSAIGEAGWGRYLHELVNDSALDAVLDAAQTATPAERAIVKLFDLDPFLFANLLESNSGDTASIHTRLSYLATLNQTRPADFATLVSLGFDNSADLFGTDEATLLGNINAIIAHYNALNPAQQAAARALHLDAVLLDAARTTALTNYFIGLSSAQKEALRDLDIYPYSSSSANDASTQAKVTSALNAYLGLGSTAKNYLLAEAEHFDLLPILTSTASNDGEGHASRSLANIVALLNSVGENYNTLLDLDLGRALLFEGYLGGTTLADKTLALGKAITFYKNLSASKQATLRGLGIIGADHVGFLGTDYSGVQRLLTAYDALPLAVRVDTQRIDETHGDDTTYADHSSYFFPFNKDTANTDGAMVRVGFESPADLYVGAVRRLRIDNSTGSAYTDTFAVGGNHTANITLNAGDLIDLNNTRYSSNARGILMNAITINLSNFDFAEGTTAALNSRDGGTADGSTGIGIYPHWGSSTVGRVNFLSRVTYGGKALDFTTQFDANARGNIAIGSQAAPAALPNYTAPANP